MTGKATHKWAFKPGMRAGAYSWKSSAKAIEQLKSESAEIRAVARTDPVTAADGVTHAMAAAERVGQGDRVLLELQRLAANVGTDVIMSARLKFRIADLEKGDV